MKGFIHVSLLHEGGRRLREERRCFEHILVLEIHSSQASLQSSR